MQSEDDIKPYCENVLNFKNNPLLYLHSSGR